MSGDSCVAVNETAAIIEDIFNGTFLASELTLLVGGAAEPLYLPAGESEPARIYYRHDYAASALHEVAHWCIAGRGRRREPDYGYWYAPDGRSAAQQEAFVGVEARPQALEWVFSRACGLPFRISVDNLDAPPDPAAERALRSAVVREAQRLADGDLPPRARRFFAALCAVFSPGPVLEPAAFREAALR